MNQTLQGILWDVTVGYYKYLAELSQCTKETMFYNPGMQSDTAAEICNAAIELSVWDVILFFV